MKLLVKKILHRLLPKFADEFQAVRDRRAIHRTEQKLGLPNINRLFIERYGLTVLDGPFQGMKYVPQAVGSAYIPKLLGSYESELHPAINEIAQSDCKTIVDIGCAEGYYAVGLARKMPDANVFAFDTAAEGRRLCATMAKENAVLSRMTIAGRCDHNQLNALLEAKNAVVICDCEGCEYDLLDLTRVPNLSQTWLLIELHPKSCPDKAEAFEQQFIKTHRIEMISSTPRRAKDYDKLAFLPGNQRQTAIDERRFSNQMWAFLSPFNS